MYHNNGLVSNLDELLLKSGKYDIVKCRKNKQLVEYINHPAYGFDIETSSYIDNEGNKKNLMYCWQLGCNGNVVIGRTWNDFLEAINKLVKYYQLNYMERHLKIYVHNLPYEFQYIRKLFTWEDVFAKEDRKVLKATTTEGIEFCCSYALSGLSLADTAQQCTKYKVNKMEGDLNYDYIRTPLTHLTKKEIGYCVHDILCITSYIEEQIEQYDNKITNIPMTNTGRVRKYLKEKCLSEQYRTNTEKLMKELRITSSQELKMWDEAFTGGFTHGSYRKSNKTYDNVSSFDFTSSYPTVMIAEKYPMSKGEFIKNITLKEIEETSNIYAYIFEVHFINLVTTFDYETLFSFSKLRNTVKPVIDNGRVLAVEECDITITDVDYEIIPKVYEWDDAYITTCYRYIKGYLPTPIVESIVDFYEKKTTLKGIEDEYSKRIYMLYKGMLNSCFGCTAEKVERDETIYESDMWITDTSKTTLDYINEYNNQKGRVLFFAWSIFITSYARRNLWLGIIEFGNDYIYSDTDSLKVLNKDNHMDFINKYNDDIIIKLKKALKVHKIDTERMQPKNIKGEKKPLGIWDYEGTYEHFKTLGAKRYMYEDNGIHLTCAGVNKKDGAKYLSKFKKPFDKFTNKLTFPENYSGRKCLTYLDEVQYIDVVDYKGVRYAGKEMSSVHMCKTKYNLTMSPIYLLLLKGVEE